MNAILEPRIVAASIHGPERLVHGVAAALDRMIDSSHGVRRKFAISTECAAIPADTTLRENSNFPKSKNQAPAGKPGD
jgi:hypothetical protein